MWVVHRVLRSGYAVASRTGIFSTRPGRMFYEFLYERFKLYMEGDSIDALCRIVAPGSLVIDVGANIGIYSNRFQKAVKDNGKVVAVEADPENAASLRRRFSNVPRVEVVEAAASDRSGSCRLSQDPYNPAGHVLGTEGIEVRSVTIDEIVASSNRPLSLIKVDVEGAEPLVLDGAVASILAHRPALYVEYSPERISRFGRAPSEFLHTLKDIGYRFFIDDWTRPLSIEEVDSRSKQKGYVDILLLAEAPRAG